MCIGLKLETEPFAHIECPKRPIDQGHVREPRDQGSSGLTNLAKEEPAAEAPVGLAPADVEAPLAAAPVQAGHATVLAGAPADNRLRSLFLGILFAILRKIHEVNCLEVLTSDVRRNVPGVDLSNRPEAAFLGCFRLRRLSKYILVLAQYPKDVYREDVRVEIGAVVLAAAARNRGREDARIRLVDRRH